MKQLKLTVQGIINHNEQNFKFKLVFRIVIVGGGYAGSKYGIFVF